MLQPEGGLWQHNRFIIVHAYIGNSTLTVCRWYICPLLQIFLDAFMLIVHCTSATELFLKNSLNQGISEQSKINFGLAGSHHYSQKGSTLYCKLKIGFKVSIKKFLLENW